MKYKNYLARTSTGEFILARGHQLEADSTLAIVQGWSHPLSNRFSIIDIASGLKVTGASQKSKCMENYRDLLDRDSECIARARNTDKYKERVLELNREKPIWRESGYEV